VPAVSCLIATTPRSGSWLLAAGLHETELAGQPEEYFRPDATFLWAREWGLRPEGPYGDYVRHALDWSTGANAVFSAKLHWYQFEWLVGKLRSCEGGEEKAAPFSLSSDSADLSSSAQVIADSFPHPKYVHLWRRDTPRQAVSYLRALQTNVWFVVDRDNRHPVESGELLAPDYHHIRWLEDVVVSHEMKWRQFFEASGVERLDVAYEDLASNYVGTIGSVVEWLGAGCRADVARLTPPLVKQADDRSESWLERYLLVRDSIEPRPWRRPPGGVQSPQTPSPMSGPDGPVGEAGSAISPPSRGAGNRSRARPQQHKERRTP